MVIAQYILLALLFVVSILHIISLQIQNFDMKAATKILLVPLIIGIYLIATTLNNRQYYWPLVAAFICGWIGDIILINKRSKAVLIGGWLFFAELVILIIIAFQISPFNSTWSIVFISSLLITISFSIFYCYKILKGQTDLFTYLVSNGYLIVHGLLFSLTLSNLVCLGNNSYLMFFLGSLLFVISDYIIIYVRLTKNPKFDKKHIIIMITYILAQLLIMITFTY